MAMQVVAARTTRPDLSAAPISPSAARIVAAASKPDVSVGELGRLAAVDPAFAARLLRAVHAPSFGLRERVTSIPHAATFVGVRGMRNLALGLALRDLAPRGKGQTVLSACLRRAAAAQAVARAMRVDPADGFTVGLCLEIGLLVVARADAKLAEALVGLAPSARIEKERADLGSDHASIGASLARRWQLPANLVGAIEAHHAEAPSAGIAAVAWAAERIAQPFEDPEIDAAVERARAAGVTIGLQAETVDEILSGLPAAVSSLAAGLDLDTGEQADLEGLRARAGQRLYEMNVGYEELVRRLEATLRERDALLRQLEEANARLDAIARVDALTGVANRRATEEMLRREMADHDRKGRAICVCIGDIDHFKSINDRHGHPAGDEALRTVAGVLARSLRAADHVGRWGGEEFVVILPETEIDAGALVADRLRAAVDSAQIETAAGTIRVSVSIGIAMATGPGCSGQVEKLLAAADAALYRAKQGGRNRVERGAIE